MDESKTKPDGRGGARAGAGRKREDKRTVAVCLNRYVAERLRAAAEAEGVSISRLANQIIARHFKLW